MHHRKDDDTPHNSDTDLTHFAIVVPIVLVRQDRAIEYTNRGFKTNPVFCDIGLGLCRVPCIHIRNLTCNLYVQF
jgi:hypothetical protein